MLLPSAVWDKLALLVCQPLFLLWRFALALTSDWPLKSCDTKQTLKRMDFNFSSRNKRPNTPRIKEKHYKSISIVKKANVKIFIIRVNHKQHVTIFNVGWLFTWLLPSLHSSSFGLCASFTVNYNKPIGPLIELYPIY